LSDLIRVEEADDLEGSVAIPSFTQQQVFEMTTQELFAALIEHAVRVPRAWFDAYAARSIEMLGVLSAVYQALDFGNPEAMHLGQWWAVIQGIHLLGQWPDETSGKLHTRLWRSVCDVEEGNWMY
jgi:hypothetical protein